MQGKEGKEGKIGNARISARCPHSLFGRKRWKANDERKGKESKGEKDRKGIISFLLGFTKVAFGCSKPIKHPKSHVLCSSSTPLAILATISWIISFHFLRRHRLSWLFPQDYWEQVEIQSLWFRLILNDFCYLTKSRQKKGIRIDWNHWDSWIIES